MGNHTSDNGGIIYIPAKTKFVVSKGFAETIFESAQKYLEDIAEIDAVTKQEVTYANFLSKTIRVAQNLRSKGIQFGDVIAQCSNNNLEYGPTTIAVSAIGAIPALLDANGSYDAIAHCLQIACPKLVFCDSELEEKVEKALRLNNLAKVEIIVYGKTEKNTPFSGYLIGCERSLNSFHVHKVTDFYSPACILYSSGTTGLPKSICCTHFGLLNAGFEYKGENTDRKSKFLNTSPFWISNFHCFTSSFLFGDTRIVIKSFDESIIMKYVEEYRINVISLAPFSGIKFILHPEYYNQYDLSSLKGIGISGSITPSKQVLEYQKIFPHRVIICAYGIAETGNGVFANAVIPAEDIKKGKTNLIGTPIPGFKYKVVDPDTEEVLGPNKEGELRVKCEGIMHSYYKNTETYKSAFDEDGFYKSADLVYYDNQHKFYYVRRIEDVFKFRDNYISPAIIERELMEYPGIIQAAVFGVYQGIDGDVPTAAILVKDKENINKEDVIKFVNDRLDKINHLEGGVYIMDEFPTTTTGKVQRRKLTEMVEKILKINNN